MRHAAPRRSRIFVALLAGALFATALPGCDDDGPQTAPWLLDPTLPMPRWLSAAGIYSDLVELAPADGFVTYEPPHPLYSNRASKARLLWLPPDTRIGTTDGDDWEFPVGAVLVKTFGYRHVEGRFGDVAIETRVIRRVDDGWQYGVYHWGAEGGEALLEDSRWPESRFLLEDVNGSDFAYVIPGELDCEACHETRGETPIIGLSAGNLDPALVADRPEVFDSPPTVTELPARFDAEARAMSYIAGNCAHCHHGRARGDNASFDMRPAALVANTVNTPTASSASGDGIRVVPGDPEGSALYEAVVRAGAGDYTGDFKPMPPVGITSVDHEAAAILGAWIRELATREAE